MQNFRVLSLALATCGALALASCGSDDAVAPGEQRAVVAKVAAPAGQKWSQVITATDDGGFVMGNPDAPIQFVEYGALTCSHCRDFAAAATEELHRDFVDTGQVTFEFRNFLLNPADALAATIITCAGKDRYYPLMENIYANQAAFIEGAQNMGQVAPTIVDLPDNQKFITFAKGIGLYSFFTARGMTETELNQCLSNPANVKRIEDRSNAGGQQFNITSTPTFVLNGSVIDDTNQWPALRQRLRDAGAR